jgi:hypothetical protein
MLNLSDKTGQTQGKLVQNPEPGPDGYADFVADFFKTCSAGSMTSESDTDRWSWQFWLKFSSSVLLEERTKIPQISFSIALEAGRCRRIRHHLLSSTPPSSILA